MAIILIAGRIIPLGRRNVARNRRPAADPIANCPAPIRLGSPSCSLDRHILLFAHDHRSRCTVYQFYGMIRRVRLAHSIAFFFFACPGNGSIRLDEIVTVDRATPISSIEAVHIVKRNYTSLTSLKKAETYNEF